LLPPIKGAPAADSGADNPVRLLPAFPPARETRSLSRFGGKATVVLASDYVSTFRGEWVEPDLVAVPVGLRFYVFRERLMADALVGRDRPQRLAGTSGV
jgi:hypothetical protein